MAPRTYKNPKCSKKQRAIDATNAAHVAWRMVQDCGPNTEAKWGDALTDALACLKTLFPLDHLRS